MRKGLILGLVAISISLTSVTVFTDVFGANPTISLTNLKPHPSAINLSDSSNADRQSVVKVNGTNIHVVWMDSTNSDILYKRSTNSGATFSDVVTVGDGNASWLSTSPVDMEVVGDYVYIVWDGSSKTYFSKSTDNGANFAAAVKLEDYGRPKISADSNNVHVIAWGGAGDDNVKYLKSTDNGANFAAAKNAGVGGIVSDIDSRGDSLYITARSGANSMKLHKSTDGGANFATSNLTTCVDFPTIEYTSTYLHFGCGYADVKYLVSDDGGGSWGTALTIDSDWAPVAPSISNGTNYVMMWRHHGIASNAAQIRFASSTDEGVTFGTPSIIDGLGRYYNSQEPSIHADGNLIGATFTSCTTNLASNICNIFFTRSTNGGTTFTPPGGSSQISHAIGANTDEQMFNATAVSGTSIIDIVTQSPANDFTIVTPNLNATIPANTAPTDTAHAQLTIKNSTRSINTNSNPNASVVGTIQELGYTNSTNINFNKFIKLSFGGTTGTTPFFINATDTYLISQCAGTPATTTQVSNDATITGGAKECYWSATNGTKFVWTNHFTAFGTGNNFGSSSSSSSSSSGGGKSSCDSSGFGMGQSLRVYQVSYDIMTQEVEVLAYSTCGAINAKIVTAGTQKILALSMDQPYLDEQKTVYKGKISPDDTKFTILVENKRDSFDETFYITDSSIIREYGTGTGYTSEQQGMTYEKQSKVPEWVKNNAKWWSDSQVDDTTFSQGIGYLIKENIIEIDNLPSSSGDSDQSVPEWVKNNAKWWADGMISEDEFLRGITYMVENGIVKVS
jgi:hypothetical protein